MAIYPKQKHRHDPENGIMGDCHRTAIATVLGLDPEELPHSHKEMSSDEFHAMYDTWLAERGLVCLTIPFGGNLEQVLAAGKAYGMDMMYLLGGESRNGVNHTVVAHGDQIIHDPSQDNSGIIGPCQPDGHYWLSFLVRRP